MYIPPYNHTHFNTHFTLPSAYVKLRYIAILYTHSISHRTRWWCLKCVIVYLVVARDIPAFVMYCVYGASRSSLLIESTDSMILNKFVNVT